MAAFWLDRLGVPIYTRVEPPVPGATAAYRVHPEGSPFITEAVVFALPRGTIIFSYVGALGAFEPVSARGVYGARPRSPSSA